MSSLARLIRSSHFYETEVFNSWDVTRHISPGQFVLPILDLVLIHIASTPPSGSEVGGLKVDKNSRDDNRYHPQQQSVTPSHQIRNTFKHLVPDSGEGYATGIPTTSLVQHTSTLNKVIANALATQHAPCDVVGVRAAWVRYWYTWIGFIVLERSRMLWLTRFTIQKKSTPREESGSRLWRSRN